MSNERIDEFLAWRRRLDDPQEVPGHVLDDREVTWEQLMDKLRETPRRRLFGYRLAAACLLLALIPAIGFLTGRHVHPLTVQAVARERTGMPARPFAPGNPARPVSPAPAAAPIAIAASTAISIARSSHRRPPPAARGPESQSIAATDVAPAVATKADPAASTSGGRAAITGAVPIAAAGSDPAAVTVVLPGMLAAISDSIGSKTTPRPLNIKSLRVVHINELPGSAGRGPAVTTSGAEKNADRHFAISLAPSELNLSSSN